MTIAGRWLYPGERASQPGRQAQRRPGCLVPGCRGEAAEIEVCQVGTGATAPSRLGY